MNSRWQALIVAATLMGAIPGPVVAQPSGGPYGPQHRTYQLPDGAGRIFHVAPDGKAEASGDTISRPTTIEAAIARVRTGDAIVLRGGTYRTGNLLLNQGITLQPYADERPVFKGTFVASEWKSVGNGIWKTSWSRLFPAGPDPWWNRDRFGKDTPLHRFNNDMVFIDGRFLKAVGREGDVDQDSYFIDYGTGQVHIGTDPTGHLVEITAFDVALMRVTGSCHGKASDRRGPILRGITFTQYAYRALEVEGKEPTGVSAESNHGKEVVGTTLEDCAITYCSRVAAYLRGDSLTIRQCRVSDTSTEGIYIIGSSDVLLEKNIFSRNNIERITGYYPAAVKIFNQSYRVTCRDNLVIDLPFSNGIWYDVGNVDGLFLNNWVEGVGDPKRELTRERPWPSDNGFFFEISKGAICAGNVFVNCDQGIFILNSSDARVYQNTLVNSTMMIARNARNAANDRTFGWHSSTGPDVERRDGHVVVNNLFAGDESYRRPFLVVTQPDSLRGRLGGEQVKQVDHNVYVRSVSADSTPLHWWSPASGNAGRISFASLEDFRRAFPGFSEHSCVLEEGPSVFKSPELGDYRVLPTFPGSTAGAPLPGDLRNLPGVAQTGKPYVGAYPPDP